jgi:hypothetical protein
VDIAETQLGDGTVALGVEGQQRVLADRLDVAFVRLVPDGRRPGFPAVPAKYDP